MTPSPRIQLVGDWTSANILLRLLEVIDSPWELSRDGLTHVETGETCRVEMRRADPALVDAFSAGECPARPSLDPETLSGIESHRAVLTVEPVESPDFARLRLAARSASKLAPLANSSWDAARAALRCGSGLVDAGGIAVRSLHSGLAHAGDHWQTLERMAQSAQDDGSSTLLGEALYQAFVMPFLHTEQGVRTLGMAQLEAPDAIIVGAQLSERHALDALEDLCLRTLGGQAPRSGQVIRAAPNRPALQVDRGPDPSDPTDDAHNPFGLWRMAPQGER